MKLKIWITDGMEERRIDSLVIPAGWHRGRKPGVRCYARRFRRVWITDGQQETMLRADIDIPEGWEKGRASRSR